MSGLANISRSKPTVTLVRHPSTNKNNPKDERVRSWGNDPLNADGKKEVKIDAQKLKGAGITHVFHSDIKRAQQTGKVLASALGVPRIETPDLRPVNWGKLEGQKVSKVKGKIENFIRNPGERAPGGERYDDFLKRGGKAFGKVQDMAAKGARPAVVSHGSHMLALDYLIGNKKNVKPGVSSSTGEPPGSILALTKNGNKWSRKDVWKPAGKNGLSNIRS